MGGIFVLFFFIWIIWREKSSAKITQKSAKKGRSETFSTNKTDTAAGRGNQFFGANAQPSVPVLVHEPVGQARPTLEEYRGSLGVTTMEGRDICDPALGHHREIEEQAPEEAEPTVASPAPPFPFAGNAMAQGIVWSEILARPSQRKWGRR